MLEVAIDVHPFDEEVPLSTAFASIRQFRKMLANLDAWIGKALVHAEAKKFDADTLVTARLAPDQYNFARQVQAACDAAKFSAAYLTGKQAPAHPDTEKTIAELRARIAACSTWIDSLSEEDFAGADERRVSPPWLHGKWMKADEYLEQTGTPNFYFHAVTAYAILRHNGVDLGKMDYIGSMPLHD